MSARQKGTPANRFRDAQRYSVRLSGVTVPRELVTAARAAAEAAGVTLSAYVRAALQAALDGTQGKSPA